MPVTLEHLLGVVNSSEISSTRVILNRIVEIIHEPNASAMDLKGVIETDPPLAAAVLRRANSAYYGTRRPMVEILDAIVCVGFEAVKELAISQKVCDLFKNDELILGYSRSQLWMHSISVALCAKAIYRREFRRHGNDIYAAGLIHDIGIVVEDQFIRADFVDALTVMHRDQINLPDAELAVQGFCHGEISQALLRAWSFPDILTQAIGAAEEPSRADTDNATAAMTLFVANVSCQARKIGYNESPHPNRALYNECLSRLSIRERALSLILDDVAQDIVAMRAHGWF